MKRLGTFLFAAVLSLSAGATLACVPSGTRQPSPAYIAKHLVAHAAAIDIVVIERSERLPSAPFARGLFGSGPDQIKYRKDLFDGQVSLADEFEPTRLTYRVVETLKGQGAKRFQLTGVGPGSDSTIQSLAMYNDVRMITAVELTPLNLSPGTCLSFPGALKGVRYLVFRDAKGALVGEVIPWENYRRRGPSYLAVPKADDPWLRTVRQAVAAERKGR
jgi:hypothetical protein